jgi:hypothetical protein
MKKKLGILVAGSALAVAGVTGVSAGTASAGLGCGATVEVHNRSSETMTIHWHHSESQADINPFSGITGGTWKALFSSSNESTISPGATASRAVDLDLGCSTQHRYRIEWWKGNNSGNATSAWDDGSFVHIDIF